MSKLVEFRERPQNPYVSHKAWTVYSKRTDTLLGSIHWYMPTKRFVFQTVFSWCYFDASILGAITTFLREQDDLQKLYGDVSVFDGRPFDDLEVQ
jgi:hypothetical protein